MTSAEPREAEGAGSRMARDFLDQFHGNLAGGPKRSARALEGRLEWMA